MILLLSSGWSRAGERVEVSGEETSVGSVAMDSRVVGGEAGGVEVRLGMRDGRELTGLWTCTATVGTTAGIVAIASFVYKIINEEE